MSRYRLLLLGLALLLALSCALSLAFGAAKVELDQVLSILGRHLFGIAVETPVSVGQDSIAQGAIFEGHAAEITALKLGIGQVD